MGWEYSHALLILSLIVTLATVAGKNVADIGDIEDDRESGRLTLPMQIGSERTYYLSVGLASFMIFLVPSLYLIGNLNQFYLLIGIIATCIMFLALLNFRRDFSKGRIYSYIILSQIFLLLIATMVGSI